MNEPEAADEEPTAHDGPVTVTLRVRPTGAHGRVRIDHGRRGVLGTYDSFDEARNAQEVADFITEQAILGRKVRWSLAPGAQAEEDALLDLPASWAETLPGSSFAVKDRARTVILHEIKPFKTGGRFSFSYRLHGIVHKKVFPTAEAAATARTQFAKDHGVPLRRYVDAFKLPEEWADSDAYEEDPVHGALLGNTEDHAVGDLMVYD